MGTERTIDCKGLACPQPVIETKDALAGMSAGEVLHVLVDNDASAANVRRFAEGQGHQVRVEGGDGGYHLTITRGEGAPSAATGPITCETPRARPVVVYVSSEIMGQGDDELGRVLMSAYLDTLTNFAKEISHVILVNSGVKLAVEGSPVLENLRSLQQLGADVLACGTCLNHFGIAEKLRVGTVSNMFAILDVLIKAERTLSP